MTLIETLKMYVENVVARFTDEINPHVCAKAHKVKTRMLLRFTDRTEKLLKTSQRLKRQNPEFGKERPNLPFVRMLIFLQNRTFSRPFRTKTQAQARAPGVPTDKERWCLGRITGLMLKLESQLETFWTNPNKKHAMKVRTC